MNFLKIFFATFFIFSFSFFFVSAQTEVSLEDKIDQMFIVGFRGFELDNAPDLKRALSDTNLGGVILFDYDTPTKKYIRNIKNYEQVKKLNTDIISSAKTKPFISIDEEGGLVSRLKTIPGYNPTPSAFLMGSFTDLAVKTVSYNLGLTLKYLGFNMNFAPSLDVKVNPKSPAIGAVGRAFSHLQSVVSNKGIIFANGLSDAGIVPVGKHFPGHGSALADSHKGFTDITNTYKQYELVPFERACKAGLPAIMVAHVFNRKVDDTYPATLSKKHINVLKNIGCENTLVISDDMDMKAITDNFGRKNALVLAINAGIDVLVLSNNISEYNSESYFEARKIIYDAVISGKISEERIDQAYNKIIKVKSEI